MVKRLAKLHIILPIIATIFLVLAVTLTFTWFGFAYTETKTLKIAQVTLNLTGLEDLSGVQVEDQIIENVEFSKADTSLACYVRGKLNFFSTNTTLSNTEIDYLLALNYNSFTPYTEDGYKWEKYYDYYYLVDSNGKLLNITDTTKYSLAKNVKFNGIRGSYFDPTNLPSNLKLNVVVEAIQSANLPETATSNVTNIKEYFDKTFDTTAPTSFIVEYDENAEGASTTIASTIYGENQKLTQPSNPTRTGYTFDGWYLDKDCSNGKKYTFTETVSDSFTLYAKWVQN